MAVVIDVAGVEGSGAHVLEIHGKLPKLSRLVHVQHWNGRAWLPHGASVAAVSVQTAIGLLVSGPLRWRRYRFLPQVKEK